MAELDTKAANDLLTQLLMIAMEHGLDPQEMKPVYYGLLHDYQIAQRSTDIVPYEGNVNTALVKKFIAVKMVNGCTKQTIEMYGRSVMSVLTRLGKPATQIEADDIRWYIALRMKDGVSSVTCNNELRALSSFFTWMRDDELIARNPVLKTGKIKTPKKQKHAFTDEDIERMRISLNDWRQKAMFEMLLSTGCRVSELCNIKIDDIRDDSVYILGKGNKYRTVYINARAKLAVENYLRERKDTNPYLFAKAAYMACSRTEKETKQRTWYTHPELVSPDQPANASTIESIIRKLGRSAGVENAHPHRFRRTCATMALKRGMPIEMVSKMLGHENLSTTQIYLDLSEDDLRTAHKKYVT